MRILILTQYFWPENFRINDIALGLSQLGHAVTVYTGMPNYPSGRFFPGYGFSGPFRESYNGISVRRAPLVPRGSGRGFRLAINYASHALCATLLAPWHCSEQYDAILVYEPSPVTIGIPARVIKRLKRVPLLFWVQDLWPQSLSATGAIRSTSILKLVGCLAHWIYRDCDRILIQSRSFMPAIEAQGIPREPIAYLPNSAEDFYLRLQPSEDDPEARELPPGFRVMFAGNIGAAQDFPTILAAADLLRGHPDIQWIVLGDGRMRPWVEREVVSRGLAACFHLLGQKASQSMPRWFAHANVLLATLKNESIFAYTIPSKIQSYLACGKTIIAALEGEGARAISEARAGFVVPPENPRALADAVLTAARLPKAQLDEMGNRAETYFKANFSRSLVLARLDNYLRDAVQEAA